MKKKLLLLSITLLSAVTILCGSAFIIVDDPFDELLKKLQVFTDKYAQEKVYLHLDKPYYAIGDNIWFKAYVTNAKTSAPSTISNMLYVELIDQDDSIKRQIMLPMESGITWGDFKLPDSLSEGNYRIRAYTQWMRNAGPAFFFDKTIKIGNSWANKVFATATNAYSTTNNTQKVTSTVQFLDKSGKPYANNSVTYDVQLNNRSIDRGKGKTDATGRITIEVVNTQPNLYKSGKIIAKLTLANNTTVTKTIPIKTTSTTTDVQFFAEGGKLVEGLPSKVAVKAVNSNGLGEDVTGTIVDNEGVEIMNFETSYLGMGALILNPLSGKTYTAKIKFKNGSQASVPLPKVEKSGFILSVNNIDTAKMAIKVMLSPDLLNTGELNLVGQHNGEVYFVTKVPTGKQLVAITAPKSEFPSGIMQLTLFSPTNEPLSERLVFVNSNKDKIDLKVENLMPSYSKREKVDLSMLANNGNTPIQGSFSIAVTNASVVAPDPENESNIYTGLLLTSDLTGYVEKPNHYFLKDDAKTRTELDLLMLTQGWRKVEWKKIADSQFPVITYQPERVMHISGKITKGGKPVPKGKVSLFSNTGGFFATDTVSDEQGNFNFDKIAFGDSVKFVVQARTEKNNKNVQIDLDIVPNQVVTTNKNTGDIEVNVNESLKSYLMQSDDYFNELVKRGLLDRTIMLQEVKIVEKKNPTPNSANLNGPGGADQVLLAKDMQNFSSLSQYLQGRVAGIMVQNGQAVSMRSGGRGAMAIILDGMNMGDEFSLDDIAIFDVESVEVLKSIGNTAIYGSRGSNGVLVITTKRGAGTESNYARYSPGIVTYAPKGYYQNRQFYSPQYTAAPDAKPDLRTTVYWNPHVATAPTGKGTFNYFNTDQAGAYRIVIEGINAEGNLVHKTFTYEVN
jgi:TonB-dependent SusC/RagA subfamily outer membrane receptor